MDIHATNSSAQDTRNVSNKLALPIPYEQSIVLLTILAVISFFGNVAILAFYGQRLNVSFNVYIFYLAVVDLLATLITITNNILILVLLSYPKTDLVCKCKSFVEYFLVGIPYAVLIVVAIDRYRKICHPFARQFDHQRTVLACIIVTIWALLNALPALALFKSGRIELKTSYRVVCQLAEGGDYGRYSSLFGIYIVLKTALRIVLYAVLYGRIIVAIRKQMQFRALIKCEQVGVLVKATVGSSTNIGTETCAYSARNQGLDSITFDGSCSTDREYSKQSTLKTISGHCHQCPSASTTELTATEKRKSVSIRIVDIKTTKITIVLTIFMVLSLIPYTGSQIYQAIHGAFNEDNMGSAYGWYRLIGYLPYTSTAANFFIYYAFHDDFRRWGLDLLKRKTVQRQYGLSHS